MPKNVRLIISWSLVILWACFIFFMSGMDTNESNNKSKGTLSDIVEKIVETTNGMGITDKHPSESKMKEFIDKYNYLFRKFAHASEYFVLTLLLILALKSSNVKGIKIFIFALLICFIYACTDEYHQTFVNGRIGQFSDCLIDTLGGFIGCIIYYLIYKLMKFKRKCV